MGRSEGLERVVDGDGRGAGCILRLDGEVVRRIRQQILECLRVLRCGRQIHLRVRAIRRGDAVLDAGVRRSIRQP